MKGRVLVTSAQVPYTRGGAEILVDSLLSALKRADYLADLVQLPFSVLPRENILTNIALWKNLDLNSINNEKIDCVISTKFPSYFVKHQRKVLWLVHQHRQMYDLYRSRFSDFEADVSSEALRRLLLQEDHTALSECSKIYTISQNVTDRLEKYLGIASEVLLPPLPLSGRYYHGETGDYILSVGRICTIKRVDFIIKALPQISAKLRLKIVGSPDEPLIMDYINQELDRHSLRTRVDFLGRVSEEQLLSLYANAHCVYYAPFDEDYGFVTLEALASHKPVITMSDSGGVLSFINHQQNGLISEPNVAGLAEAVNLLAQSQTLYEQLVEGCKQFSPPQSWEPVIEKLLGKND
jgi:glycosyltransferase involved in cell wall biosynthesis